MKIKQLMKRYPEWLILRLSSVKFTARRLGTKTLLIARSPDSLNAMIKAVNK